VRPRARQHAVGSAFAQQGHAKNSAHVGESGSYSQPHLWIGLGVHDNRGEDIIEIDASHIPTQAAGLPPQAADHIPPQAGGQFPQTFADLNIQEVNGNSVIQFDAHDSVTVVGVTGLTAADFHFVII